MEISANSGAGIAIDSGGDPTVRRSRIHGNGTFGVRSQNGGRGRIGDNDLRANTMGPVFVAPDSSLQMNGNLLN